MQIARHQFWGSKILTSVDLICDFDYGLFLHFCDIDPGRMQEVSWLKNSNSHFSMCVTTSVGGLTVAIVTNIVLTYPILRNLRPSPCIQGKFNCRTSSQVICQGTDLVLAINNFGPRYASGTQESQSLQNSQCPKTKPCRYNISLLQCFFPEC